MAIRYNIDVLAALKNAGYSQTSIRSEKLLGVSVLSKIRAGGLPSWHELDVICRILNLQPGDIVEYVEDCPSGKERKLKGEHVIYERIKRQEIHRIQE